MRVADIKQGMKVWTKIGEDRVQVEVYSINYRSTRGGQNRATYTVRRVDNGKFLPKARSATALHERGDGYWAGMTESPEVNGRPAPKKAAKARKPSKPSKITWAAPAARKPKGRLTLRRYQPLPASLQLFPDARESFRRSHRRHGHGLMGPGARRELRETGSQADFPEGWRAPANLSPAEKKWLRGRSTLWTPGAPKVTRDPGRRRSRRRGKRRNRR
jgi:hypothetical protein